MTTCTKKCNFYSVSNEATTTEKKILMEETADAVTSEAQLL